MQFPFAFPCQPFLLDKLEMNNDKNKIDTSFNVCLNVLPIQIFVMMMKIEDEERRKQSIPEDWIDLNSSWQSRLGTMFPEHVHNRQYFVDNFVFKILNIRTL